jgi:tRNA acetyltransferase TAN1
VPRKGDTDGRERRTIQPGDSGIWVTCNKGKESQCIGELRDLFCEHAEALYGETLATLELGRVTDILEAPSDVGIENEIQDEIAEMQQPSSRQLFTPIRIDVPCGKWMHCLTPILVDNQAVIFFKTVDPVEPVSFVKDICEAAMSARTRKRTRFAKRFSPMTLMGRASEEGLDEVAKEVLRPQFHQEPFQRRKVSYSCGLILEAM